MFAVSYLSHLLNMGGYIAWPPNEKYDHRKLKTIHLSTQRRTLSNELIISYFQWGIQNSLRLDIITAIVFSAAPSCFHNRPKYLSNSKWQKFSTTAGNSQISSQVHSVSKDIPMHTALSIHLPAFNSQHRIKYFGENSVNFTYLFFSFRKITSHTGSFVP